MKKGKRNYRQIWGKGNQGINLWEREWEVNIT
jgi:hypothetical protein